jgi:hypothetical protein
MSVTWEKILGLIRDGDIGISDHGYDELVEDDIGVREIVAGAPHGIVLEDYSEYPKGPCVLVLQRDRQGQPIHVVWGIPRGFLSPAVLVTAYRPSRHRWTEDFKRRKK